MLSFLQRIWLQCEEFWYDTAPQKKDHGRTEVALEKIDLFEADYCRLATKVFLILIKGKITPRAKATWFGQNYCGHQFATSIL